ncbi:MAG: aminotransferase, partial [Deltaproteobacteria bacterium HGW-Deltaproteobacteria-17]
VRAPEGMNAGDLIRIMNQRYGVIVAGGQDDLKGKIFRIGHVGYYDYFDLLVSISALEMALAELGYPFENGAGMAAAQGAYMEASGL